MGLLILESPKKKKKSKRKIISPDIHHHGIYTHTHPLKGGVEHFILTEFLD